MALPKSATPFVGRHVLLALGIDTDIIRRLYVLVINVVMLNLRYSREYQVSTFNVVIFTADNDGGNY